MIVTVNMSFELDDLLDLLGFELVDDEDFEESEDDTFDYEYDEDGVLWLHDHEEMISYYFDDDLNDWAEIDENGDIWYIDEEDTLFWYDEESDDWLECELFEDKDDVAAW